MLEVEFEKGKLCDGVEFEWATRGFDGRFDLIMHFFLGQKRAEPKFFKALHDALVEHVPDTHKLETGYTAEVDGHDLVIMGVSKFKVRPMVGLICKTTLQGLSPDMRTRLAAAPQEKDHGQNAAEGATPNAAPQSRPAQGKGAPVRLD